MHDVAKPETLTGAGKIEAQSNLDRHRQRGRRDRFTSADQGIADHDHDFRGEKDGAAAGNRNERSSERRRLGADAAFSRFDFAGAGRGRFGRTRRCGQQVAFENGGTAKKGDLLVQLDASAEEAQLHSAEADLQLARADWDRAADLATRKVISKAEKDAAESKFKQKAASVDQMRSMITKKTVRAPFDGQLGIRQVNVGQSLEAGQLVVPLTSLDPVFADFALPQQDLGKLSQGLEVHVTTDALPGHVFDGKVSAVNPMVDSSTRNVTLQATLENPEHLLKPGMFAKVEVVLPEKHKSIVIPGSAISYAPFGDSVFVIEKKKDEKTGKESQTIRQQFVRVGEARGDFVSINEGLKAGETIVATGVFKLRNGMSVTINNDLAPKPQMNPNPVDS